MTNKQAALSVLAECPGQYISYRFVANEILRRGISGLGGKTPWTTIDRDLRELVEEGRAETKGWGSGLFRLSESESRSRQSRMSGF